jgi:transcriptional regulator with XRE-family HTH domain
MEMRFIDVAPLDPSEIEKPEVRQKRKKRSIAVPSSFDYSAPDTWRSRVDAIGSAISRGVTERYHDMYLAISGAILKSGVAPSFVPSIVHAIALRAGSAHPDAHRKSAEDTVVRYASGISVTGIRELKTTWPIVADAIVDAIDDELAKIRAETRRVETQRRTLKETTDELRRVIREAPDGLTVIAASTGLGKTHAAQDVAAERASKRHLNIVGPGSRAPFGSKTAISVDKNELAIQITSDLRDQGVSVKRFFGVLSLKREDGQRECRYYESAVKLAAGGQSIPWEFCSGRGQARLKCDYYDECLAKEGFDGPKDARVSVGTHAMIGKLDHEAGATGLLVIDEPPNVLVTTVITPDEITATLGSLSYFAGQFAKEMQPILLAMQSWRDPELSFVDVTDSIPPPHEIEDGTPPVLGMHMVMARRNAALAGQIGNASGVLRAIYRAMTSPRLVSVRLEERGLVVTTTNETLTGALMREGSVVVTNANAETDLPAYRKIVGYEPPFHRFEAEDGASIERTFLRCGSATRTGWFSHGRLQLDAGFLGAVRAAVEWADKGGAVRLGIISFAQAELLIRCALGDASCEAKLRDRGYSQAEVAKCHTKLRPLLESFLASAQARADLSARVSARPSAQVIGTIGKKTGTKAEIELAHYGATRGLNRFKECDALVTIGDPWANFGDTSAEAEFLGVEGDAHAESRCRDELEQAHGRLRVVHRDRPGRALHVGRVLPGGLGWREGAVEVDRLEGGRPKNASAMGLDELERIIDQLGGQRELARRLGVNNATLSRYASGKRAVPPGVASEIRDLAIGVSATPSEEGTGDLAPVAETPFREISLVGVSATPVTQDQYCSGSPANDGDVNPDEPTPTTGADDALEG